MTALRFRLRLRTELTTTTVTNRPTAPMVALPAGLERSVLAESTTALLVQRWLLTGEPVTHEYADEVLAGVVLPLLRAKHP